MVTIAIDAMGGDYAPQEQVKGCVLALNNDKDLSLILCGDESMIKAELAKYEYDASRVEIVHTTEVIEMNDIPTKAVKSKKDSSTVVAFRMVKEGRADGLVCSGSTGAVLVCGTTMLYRIKGVSRPALAPVMPSDDQPFMLIDCGANADCRPEMLVQFAHMGSIYMSHMYPREGGPRVGLLNVGTEDTKGGELQLATFPLLKESGLNFIGNVEAREVPHGAADVVVADGFSGNVMMKTMEGTASLLTGLLKKGFKKNVLTMFAALLMKSSINELKCMMDYKEVGGAPLLGISKPVIKAHGSSDAKAFSNAIRQTVFLSQLPTGSVISLAHLP